MGWIVISIYEYPLPQGCSVAGLIQLDQILLKQGQVKVDSWHINVMWVTVELPMYGLFQVQVYNHDTLYM